MVELEFEIFLFSVSQTLVPPLCGCCRRAVVSIVLLFAQVHGSGFN